MSRLLEGLKVLDFSWVIVGPLVTKFLADNGATVIRVESNSRVDAFRFYAPSKDNTIGVNRSGPWAAFNSGKLGMTLNMERPEAREVAKRLVAWCDVMVENYTPATVGKWGLDYEGVKKIKEDIIMFSMSSLGHTGPLAQLHGTGYHLVGYGGFSTLTGFPDREPMPLMPYTDFVAPPFGVAAILGALDYRKRTGKGMYIDISQTEASLHFLGPSLLDYSANGRIAQRHGNFNPHAAPHGAYRCRDDDRWCAIAVFSEEQWQAFLRAIGNPDWAADAKFASLAERNRNLEELDRRVGEWTSERSPEEIVQRLQGAGIPVAEVKGGKDLAEDPQLAYRNFFQRFEHQELGEMMTNRSPSVYSDADSSVPRGAPTLGQDTEYVCTQILGMSDEELLALIEADALR